MYLDEKKKVYAAFVDYSKCFDRIYRSCVYYGFATTMFGITQISLLAAIAIDRFVIIVKPRGFAFSKSKAIAAVILCYIIGCLWAMFPAVGWSSYQLEGIRVRCAINWRSKRVADVSFTLSALILAWMVPLFVIVVSYAGIFHRLQREQTTKFRQSLKQRSSRLKRDRKMAITVLLMIGAFLISWTPYSVVTLIVTFGKVEYVPTIVTIFPALIAKTSIIWNPMIYVARHSLFRKALLELVPCLRVLLSRQRKTIDTAAMIETSRVSSIMNSSSGINKINITEKVLQVDTSDETFV
ncbi:parapinopsin-like [Mya arenaria]|uniref:parapinopsin-like n=1 Tax=Mya arenaria TaxID=6604 RepID=UPI0022E795D3|nr:parapinopsin-like [Mya arenaria]